MSKTDKATTGGTEVNWNPVECKGAKDNCNALIAWGTAWQAWGEEVKLALASIPGAGGPTTVSSPPKPPFKP